MDSFDLGCAVISAAAYREGRNPRNQTPIPSDATQLAGDYGYRSDTASGFEASAYQYQGKIVVAFAGTNTAQSADLMADVALGVGLADAQLRKAVDFYQAIKAQYGAENVVFTGHSLGGGLAALMAVFFNKPAITFDQGPFRLAAGQENAQRLQDYITHATASRGALLADTDLASFTSNESLLINANPQLAATVAAISPLLALLASSLTYPTSVRGEANIKSYAVSGEFLTRGLGGGLTAAQLNDLRLQAGESPELIQINPTAAQLGYSFDWQRAMSMHSMALLVAAAHEPALVPLVQQMPAVLKALFDKTLYSHEASDSTADFLNKLLQNEFGPGAPTGVIGRFVADLQRLGSAGATRSAGIEDGLIATIIEYYNSANPLETTPFTHLGSNGLTFDLSRIADTSDFRGQERLLEALGQQVDASVRMRALSVGIPATEWTVQVGENQLFTPGTEAGEVQIGGTNHSNDMHGGGGDDLLIDGSGASTLDGGSGDDVLIGGDGADLLYGGLDSGSASDRDYLAGGAGNDSLTGGLGRDELYGGAGNDTYNLFLGGGSDIIKDSDGVGTIFVDGVPVTAGDRISPFTWWSADRRFIIEQQQVMLLPEHRSALIIHEVHDQLTITVQGWGAGQLGINLTGAYPNPGDTAGDVIPVSGGGSGLLLSASSLRQIDYRDYLHSPGARWTVRRLGTARSDGLQMVLTEDNEWPPTTQLSGTGDVRSYLDMDNLRGSTGNDRVFGLAGNDALEGAEGDDYLDGGDGRDLLLGGPGNDQLIGGDQGDVIVGDRYNTTVGLVLGSQYGDVYEAFGGGAILEFNGLGWGVERLGPFGSLTTDLMNGVSSDYSGGGSDVIDAGAGDDDVQGGDGDDVIDGGEGNDEILGEAGDDIANGGLGDDFIVGDGHQNDPTQRHVFTYSDIVEQGRDTLHGGDDNDRLIGGGNDDRLYGDEGNDILEGDDGDFVTVTSTEYGKDVLEGGGGDDFLYGGGNDDTLSGGDGIDVIRGDADDLAGEYHGRDTLSGDAGNDTLAGGGNDDRLFGGDGDDFLIGDADEPALTHEWHGNDRLDGGIGDDRLLGGGGSDTLYGGEGADAIFGDQGTAGLDASAQLADFIDGGSGNDSIAGGGGSDTILGGDGADLIDGDDAEDRTPASVHGGDSINAGAGNDVAFGSGGDDSISGGDGDDQLQGDAPTLAAEHHGADYIAGGLGNDLISGDGGDDVLYGNEGDDEIQGDNVGRPELTGDDYLDGGAGSDTLFGQAGDDVLIGSVGDDALLGGDGNDELNGGEGDDTLFGGTGNDTLHGGTGNDWLEGGAGDDTYVFDEEDLRVVDSTADGIIDTEGHNRLVFRSGMGLNEITLLEGSVTGTVLISQDDNALGLVIRDALSGSVSSFEFRDGTVMPVNRLIGGRYDGFADQDTSVSGAALFGGTRSDSISGYGSDTTISGGQGNDLLRGGSGSTTYLFERGDGSDVITDASTFATSGGLNENILSFGNGIAAGDVSLIVNAGDNRIAVDIGQGDRITLTDFSSGDALGALRTIDRVVFSNGEAATWEQLLGDHRLNVTNTEGIASFVGTNLGDDIVGVSIGETINAGTGDDVINGGGGNDRLTGGLGSDTYVLQLGSGADTIDNFDTATGKVDRLAIDPAILTNGVDFYRVGQSLLVRVRNTSDQVFVSDYFGTAGLDEIVFGDGTVFTVANVPWQSQAESYITYARGDGAKTFAISDSTGGMLDALRLSANVDPASVVLTAGNNGDLIVRFRNTDGSLNATDRITFSGALLLPIATLDRIVFDADAGLTWAAEDVKFRAQLATPGNDQICGTLNDESLAGLGGNDIIDGFAGDDELAGGAGNDTLRGGEGNDVLVGGSGNDTLEGGQGSDTFLVNLSSESDTIQTLDANAQSIDVLQFGAGIDASAMRVSYSGTDVFLSYSDPTTNASMSVRIVGYLDASHPNQVVDEIRFSDAPGVVWTLADVQARAFGPTAGDEVIIGSSADEVLLGLGGSDELRGNAGNDDLDGGTGSDLLYGGAGNDTYRFGLGSGSDQIIDSDGIDRIVLNAGILPADVTLSKTEADQLGNPDLVISLNVNDELVVTGYYQDASPTMQSIVFADGTIWTTADIASRVVDLTGNQNHQVGTSANDTYSVNYLLDSISEVAAGGTDSVNSTVSYQLPSNVENLSLLGTANLWARGNDLNNTIAGNSGNNSIDGGTGADTLQGGAGDDVYTVSASNELSTDNDIVIENPNEGYDTYVITRGYGGTLANNVERLIYHPGTAWFAGSAALLTGNDLDNVIDASASATATTDRFIRIDGGAGADWMIGSDIRNVYIVDNVGDIVDERGHDVPSVAYEDTVVSSVSFTLPTLVENLTLTGSAAISGTGNAGANTIDGGSGNGAANLLIGGAGDDRYVLGAGDSVIEGVNEGIDTIVLDSSSLSSFLDDYANVENMELGSEMTVATGSSGDNRLVGSGLGNTLYGGAGNDVLLDSGGPGSVDIDSLYGGAGNDTLNSYGGADTLDGGAGDDQLIAYAASGAAARFMFGRGYDYDTIQSARGGPVVFDATVAVADPRMARSGADLFVYIGTTDRLTIIGAFSSTTAWTFAAGFTGFTFSDGTFLGSAAVQAAVQSSIDLPSMEADAITGSSVRDRIDAMAGDDVINAAGGDDVLSGGLGNDVLNGEAGADTLDGGAGNDILEGGTGADTYVFSAGFGRDTISDTASGETQDSGRDAIVFDASIAQEEMAFRRSTDNESDLWIERRGTVDRITVERFYDQGSTGDQIEEFRFADGSVVTLDDLISWPVIDGTEAADTLQGVLSTGSRIFGRGGDDTLQGGAARDLLDGGSGADFMAGGAGSDSYRVDDSEDIIAEQYNEGDDSVESDVSFALPSNVENVALQGAAAINATGNSLANLLSGNAANNRLDGGLGADILSGGAGDDTYVVDDTDDVVTELPGNGYDTVESGITYVLPGTVEALRLQGSDALNGTGNELANYLQGNNAANVLDGGSGSDTMIGGDGDDLYIVDSVGDHVTEEAGTQAGLDEVRSSVTYVAPDNVETLRLLGAATINATGNSANNTLIGNSAQNILDGGAGADEMHGGGGNDVYAVDNLLDDAVELPGEGYDIVESSVDYSLGANIEELHLGGTAIAGTGNELSNSIYGNSQNNVLDGGANTDFLHGGAGDDTFLVDGSDFAFENVGEGVDTVLSAETYVLGGFEIENLTLLGLAAINGTGNNYDNVILGNGAANILSGGLGNDTLDGGAGNDQLSGGDGNDTYIVGTGDTVSESSNKGTDMVQSSVNWTLSSNVENLVLLGVDNITGTGNTLANQITGNDGNNTLNGGSNADTLIGGAGNDTYVVDNAGDIVVETAGAGTDLVQASVNYTIGANVENITLTGSSAINAVGNALDNVLTGNSGNNVLDGGDGNDTINGGSGSDTMSGGLGDDTYVVAQTGDVVNENAGQGSDLVQSSIAWTLGANIENLTLTGSSGVAATGNALSNILIGNSGANTLTGGDGNDTLDGGSGTDNMSGGQGDDIYFVNTSSDVTTESPGQGLDAVNSSVTRTLGADIEVLFLTGTSAVNGTGNALSNLLRGNAVNNTLAGNAGIDILEGGAGNDTLSNTTNKSLLNGGADTDTLTGTAANDLLIGGTSNDALTTGAGADIIVFNRGDGQDTVAASTTRDNTISIGGAVYADLLFQKNGNDLILEVGATDRITFVGYYTSSSNRSVNNLQVVIEGTSEYDSGSTDALRNKRIESFNFEGLVAAFDAARTADPTLTTWSLTNALLAQHLSGSDTAAIGGDLAYRYNRFGTLSDISFTPALGILGASGFGTTAQALQGLASLQDSSARLS